MSKAHVSWGAWVSSDESNRRAGGRRRWIGVRRLRAKMRRHELIRLCATDGLHYGCRVRWAKALKVAPSTITADLNIILLQHQLEPCSRTQGNWAVGRNRQNDHQESIMSTRVTVRLSPKVHGELKRRARQQGQSLAAFIRHQLAVVVAQSAVGAANTLRRPDRVDILGGNV
jgi:hypothetical protein